MAICRACHEETTFEHDPGSGTAYCPKCGSVAEENQIVSEVTFGENSTGAAVVNGAYVGADQTRVKAPGGRRPAGAGGVESREQTIANGRRKIQAMINALRLPDRFTDQAQRFYSLALNNNFVRGRRTNYVVSACLYIVCRMEKTSHMLIDFSDLLQVNVFILGSTYLKLVKDLSLTIPAIDPSLFISRFASLLEFGDETQQVANDATRLVQRFSRDWMHTGRRPAGICGAALILASRMNNFRRSIEEIVQVVKIADITLKKRLEEFTKTSSSNLTINDFRTVDLTETSNPPAFFDHNKEHQHHHNTLAITAKQRNAAKGKKVRFSRTGILSDDEEENEEDVVNEDGNGEEEEEDREATPRATTKKSKGSMQAINAQMDQLAAEGGVGLAAEEDDEDMDDTAWSVPMSEQDEDGNIRNATASITAAEEDEEGGSDQDNSSSMRGSSITPGGQYIPAELGWNANKQLPVDTRTAEEIAADEAESAEITNEIASELHTPHYSTISHELADKEQARWQNARNPAALQYHVHDNSDTSGMEYPMTSSSGFPPDEQHIDTLSDLDEDELDALILTEEEVKIKERLWMEFNKDYLANVAEKHLRAELDEKPIKPRDRKKKMKARDSSMPSGETAAESTKALLKQKKFSKKINYAAIDALLADNDNQDEKDGDGGQNGNYRSGGFFDEVDDHNDAFSRSSRASSLAPSLAGSEGGYSTTSGLLRKRKRSSSKSSNNGNSKRKSSNTMQDAERLKRKLEMSSKNDRIRKSTFSPIKGSTGNKVLQAKRNGGNPSGDPSKSGSSSSKRGRMAMDGQDVGDEGDVPMEPSSVADTEAAEEGHDQSRVEADQTVEMEEEEEEEEEYVAPPPPEPEDEDDMVAEFRRLRGQSGGDEYGDGDEGWD